MGLFDGDPSSADLAARLGLPVLAVIDASAMAQTFGAVAHGLAHYRSDIQVVGVIANRVAGPGHAEMLAHSVENGVEYLGYLPQNAEFALPERHLRSVPKARGRRHRHSAGFSGSCDRGLRTLTADGHFRQEDDDVPPLLDGVRIRSRAMQRFSFIYPANLDLLEKLGAEPVFFSPLEHDAIPTVDSLWFQEAIRSFISIAWRQTTQ
jgi:cobyrinic acid a,c-diamide synthase